jgi:pimeloyl-ACP methyl ester carboxylesterase
MSRLVTFLGVLAWLGAAAFFIGVHVRVSRGAEECLMTYMLPSYKRYPVNSTLDGRYRLILYKENKQEPAVASVAREAGIPVIYVPGNAGSFQQVRSFGSEAYRGFFGSSEFDKSLRANNMHASVLGELMGLGSEGNTLNSFDLWAVNFREELSGLSGVLVEKQTEYLVDAIHSVLQLYATTFEPRVARVQSVVLLGHSMGGLVALGAVGHARLRPGAVHTIITLATPLTPAVLPDAVMAQRYAAVDAAVQRGAFSEVAFVSIGGGGRDVQIPSRLALPSAAMRAAPERCFYADTKSVPRVYLETDHVNIVWCNQVVKAVVAGLFRMINPKTRLPYDTAVARTKALALRLWGRVEREKLGLADKQPHPVAVKSAEAVDLEMRMHAQESSVVLEKELAVIKGDVCVVYNVTIRNRPLLLALSRSHARIVARLASGAFADVSHLLIPTSAMHLDDPRSIVFVPEDHLLVRGVARIVLGNVEQLMVCPNKTTFRTDLHHVCVEGEGDCSVAFSSGNAASRLLVNFESRKKNTEGATVIAVNAADGQMRVLHSLRSGVSAPIRFDGSRIDANVTLLVIYPANTDKRSATLSPDVRAMLQDGTRPLLPEAWVASLVLSCVLVLGTGVPLVWICVLAFVGAAALAGSALLLLPAKEDAFAIAFVWVGGLVLCVAVSVVARVIVAIRFFALSKLVFTVLSFAAAGGSYLFGCVDAVAVFVLLLLPSLHFKSPKRALALTVVLLHSLACQVLSLAAWTHVAINVGYKTAVGDAQNVALLGAVLGQTVLAAGWLPRVSSRVALVLVAPIAVAMLVRSIPNAVYLASWTSFGIGGFAFAIASLVSWKEKTD